jgi:enoyl-[acyl-carrier protein] reductase I
VEAIYAQVGDTVESKDLMSLLAGKIGLVVGVANKRSIAWAIAQAWHKAGATSPSPTRANASRKMSRNSPAPSARHAALPCDVTKDEEIAARLGRGRGRNSASCICCCTRWLRARAKRWKATFFNTSREAFRVAHDVSAYSLIALARGARR